MHTHNNRSVISMMNDAMDSSNAPCVSFGEHKYALFWTTHALERLSEQGKEQSAMEEKLIQTLSEISAAHKTELAEEHGFFCIRNLRDQFFVVLHLTQSNQRLRVVTIDSNHVLFPREGEVTYQITEKDIILRVWEKI